jgi:DNA primase
VTDGLDLATAQGKATAARQLAPIIREIGDSVERTHYTQKLARLVRMDERALVREIGRGRRVAPSATVPLSDQSAPAKRPSFGLEEYCLSRLLRHPQLLSSVDALLREADEPPLRAEDFTRPEIRELFALLRHAPVQHGALDKDAERLRSQVPTSLQPAFEQLVENWMDASEVGPGEVEKDLGDAVLRLRARNLKRWGEEVWFLFEEAMSQGDARADEYSERMRGYTAAKRRVDQALAMRSAFGQRRREDSVGRKSPVRA